MVIQSKNIISALSTRELEILGLLQKGNSTSEIAKRLNLDYKTVADISKDIKTRLSVDTITQLADLSDINDPDK